jgi:hypothetical protein
MVLSEAGGESVDLAKCPDVKMINEYQGKNNEVKVFNNNGEPEAYMFNAGTGKWDNVGKVVNPSNSSGKKYYHVHTNITKRETIISKKENMTTYLTLRLKELNSLFHLIKMVYSYNNSKFLFHQETPLSLLKALLTEEIFTEAT